MKTPTFRKHGVIKALGTLALSCALSPLAYADWSVQGSQILDPNGKPFVYRGVNLGILVTSTSLPQVYADIAATGANAVRIPVDKLSVAQAKVHINLCKQHKMVCVFTYVTSAGYLDNSSPSPQGEMYSVWQRLVDLLKANTDYVAIDIAGPLAGNVADLGYYSETYKNIIIFMRLWGLKNQLIISGGNWGQDWSSLMRDNAETLLTFDKLKNTVLSVHMYEAYRDPQTIRSYLESYKTRNLPIIIGEFGPIKRDRYNEYKNPFTTTDANVDAIMDIAQELGVGYLGWNWSGYTTHDLYLTLPNYTLEPADYTSLNIVTDFNSQLVTSWGNQLINSDTGIKATAKPATHFPEGGSSSSESGNLPPTAEILYQLSPASCGAMAGDARGSSVDPEGDPLSFSWEIYQSNTMTTTYETGGYFRLVWPAQSETTVTLYVNDGHGNVSKDVSKLGLNTNLDTCAGSSSSKPVSSASTSSLRSSSSTTTSANSSVPRSSSSSSKAQSSSSSSRSVASSSVVSSSSIAAKGNCSYVINSQWGNGFTASIRVKNTGTQPINGWNVNWQYSDGSAITGSWNASVSGNNPFSAKNVNWNATITPGQTVEFGFQGKKPTGAAQTPVVTGSICR